MSHFATRLNRLECTLAGRECIACAAMPRVFMTRMDNSDDEAAFNQCMEWHRANCTCGIPHRFKRIILRHGRGNPMAG